MMILWFALLMSVVMFFIMGFIVAPDTATSGMTSMLEVVFAAIATFLVGVSFVVKRKLLERSVNNQDVTLVQQALVTACALCEAAAVLGFVGRLLLGNHTFFFVFIIAAIGIALHFPRRDQLAAATYKQRTRESL